MKKNIKGCTKGNFKVKTDDEALIIKSKGFGKDGELIFDSNEEIERRLKLGMLIAHEYCIAFNKKQDISIWNYMLSEDKTKLFVFDEEDETIYDGLVIDTPQDIFEHGEIFAPISFRGLNLPDNIVTRKNFYLFESKIFRNIGDR